MAELTTIARPYAKAAFEFARDKGLLADWSAQLALAAGLAGDAEFRRYLAQPALTADEQVAAVKKLIGDKINAEFGNFVTELARNGRIQALPEVAALYEDFRADLEELAEVEVTSAYPISEQERTNLAAKLSQKLGRKVAIETVIVDKTLIGGVVIRSGDLVIDASVRGKLGKLGATLNS